MVCEEIFAKCGFGPFGVNQRLLLTLKVKYPYKVILSTIQPNVNFYMFRAQVLAKKTRRDDTYRAVSLLQLVYAKPFLEGYSETLTESCCELCQASISREN